MKVFVLMAFLFTCSFSQAKPSTGFRVCTLTYVFASDGSVGYRLTGNHGKGEHQILVETDPASHHAEDAYEEGTADLCRLKSMQICGAIAVSEDGQQKPVPDSQCVGAPRAVGEGDHSRINWRFW